MRRMMLIVLGVLTMTLIGCDKKSETGGSDEEKEKKAAEKTEQEADTKKKEKEKSEKAESKEGESAAAAVAEETPFEKYDLESIAKAWQGNWIVPVSMAGDSVWKIEGGKVTVYDGKEEKMLDFEIIAPCSLRRIEKTENGKTSSYTTFAVGNEKTFAGLGSAGVVTEKGAVVCTGGNVYELTESGCKEWKERFGKWESSEAECSLEDGTFTVDSKKLQKTGEVLVDKQMKGNEVKSHASFDEAKKSAFDTK